MGTPMQEQQQQQQLQREEDEDFAHVPFDDDDDEQQDQQQSTPTPLPQDESLLHLSEDVSALDTTLGLDDSRDTQKRKSVDELPRKRRKRRKVVIDNDATELSNEHIKEMLADTSDLVKRQAHPADAPDDDMDEANDKEEFVPILTRPFLADTGHLHPTLAQLWTQNFYRALDLPCSFEKLETEEDVEHARQQQQQPMDEEDHSDMESVPTVLHEQQEQAEEEPDDFVPPPMDEEEEEDPMAPVFNDSEDEEQVLQHASIGDLGLVNELQLESDDDEEDEEQREVVGEHTGTKWHKHTVKVLKLLQSRLRAEDQDDDTKPMDLEFGELAKNVNRRTAASCFMECLVSNIFYLSFASHCLVRSVELILHSNPHLVQQLKTWDFLELAQDEEYGPIIIAAGPRFQESPPNEA